MMLFKPTPILASQNRRDCASTYAVLFSQFTLEDTPLRVAFAYLFDLFFCEFRYAVRFAARLTLLGYFVGNVIVIRAQEKMRWVTAKAICFAINSVANIAFVQNMKAAQDRPISENPCGTVHKMLSKESGVTVKTVTLLILRSLPQPTIVSVKNVDIRPKVFLGKHFFGLNFLVMISDESHWFALCVLAMCILVYACFLTTTAVAKTVGDFVRGDFWCMILHGIRTSIAATEQVAESFTRRFCYFLFALITPIIVSQAASNG